jgi:hypothetical protein
MADESASAVAATQTTKTEIHWNAQLERILASEGERALCFMWMHNRSEKRYSKFTSYIALPVIVLSTLNGFVSAAGGTITDDPRTLSVAVGVVSMGVGVLNTLTSYFSWAKRAEAHRMVALQYSKVHRSIMLELALPREERIRANDMLKMVRDQLDRLHETSPQVPDAIIADFRKHFADTTPEVSKPEITNGLDPIDIYVDEENRKVRANTPNANGTPQTRRDAPGGSTMYKLPSFITGKSSTPPPEPPKGESSESPQP